MKNTVVYVVEPYPGARCRCVAGCPNDLFRMQVIRESHADTAVNGDPPTRERVAVGVAHTPETARRRARAIASAFQKMEAGREAVVVC